MSFGDAAGGPQADMSDGAGADWQAASDEAPDGTASDGGETDAADELAPPPVQAAVSAAIARIAAQGPVRTRSRGTATA